MKSLLTALFLTLTLIACDDVPNTADQQMAKQQEQVAEQANAQVGMPGVTNFTEKKIVRELYELRDKNISTFSYIPDLQGRLWHLCDSIGYGLPYGVQFTNPEVHHEGSTAGYSYNIPQPEPNGLFMPPTADGTWVICAGPKGEPRPVYVEPRVIVSPFKLNAAGEYMP
ncbi:MAG: hypothetical protein LAO08_20220 [Acidobacteriia bacterium]|nr:hypothetical protein [Terriglobia bacterium]